MITPVSKNFTLFKGATFSIKIRLKNENDVKDMTGLEVQFNASDVPGGTNVFSYSSEDSPAFITVDADNYITISIPAADTATITNPDLYYEIDVIDGATVERWMLGTISCKENAA